MCIFEIQDKTHLNPWAKASLIDSAIHGKHVTKGGNGSNHSPDVSFLMCPGGGVMANSIWNRSRVCVLLCIRFNQVDPFFFAMIWKYASYKLVSLVFLVKKWSKCMYMSIIQIYLYKLKTQLVQWFHIF